MCVPIEIVRDFSPVGGSAALGVVIVRAIVEHRDGAAAFAALFSSRSSRRCWRRAAACSNFSRYRR